MTNHNAETIKLLHEEVGKLRRQLSDWRGRAEQAETRVHDLEVQLANVILEREKWYKLYNEKCLANLLLSDERNKLIETCRESSDRLEKIMGMPVKQFWLEQDVLDAVADINIDEAEVDGLLPSQVEKLVLAQRALKNLSK